MIETSASGVPGQRCAARIYVEFTRLDGPIPGRVPAIRGYGREHER